MREKFEDWNNEPPKDDFPYDKPDYPGPMTGSYRLLVWTLVILALCAVSILWIGIAWR